MWFKRPSSQTINFKQTLFSSCSPWTTANKLFFIFFYLVLHEQQRTNCFLSFFILFSLNNNEQTLFYLFYLVLYKQQRTNSFLSCSSWTTTNKLFFILFFMNNNEQTLFYLVRHEQQRTNSFLSSSSWTATNKLFFILFSMNNNESTLIFIKRIEPVLRCHLQIEYLIYNHE